MDIQKFKSIVLYEDNHLLVINKESGISVQNEGENDNSFYHYAKNYLKINGNKKGEAFLGMVHRLDKDVSGVLIFAKNSKSAARLFDEISNKRMEKIYLAVVSGGFKEKNGELNDYLIKDNRKTKVVPNGFKNAKKAILNYNVIFSSRSYSLLKINLITGFYHQIRCQLANINHPILGDLKYFSQINPGKKRIFLHCFQTKIKHPVFDKILTFRADLPDNWSLLQSFCPELYCTLKFNLEL